MSDLTIALLTIFGTVASVSGVVLYVFNGTRSLIKEMHKTQQKMLELQHEMLELQHEMLELLKKGFSDLSRDIREIKEVPK